MLSRRLSLSVLLAAMSFAGPAHSQNQAATEVWQPVDQMPQNRPASGNWGQPDVFRAFNLNYGALKGVLGHTPKESALPVALSPTELSLPMPDGSLARFRIVESPVMAPELAAKFPEIKTYLGQGVDDPTASVRFDLTPAGFHSQILSPQGAVYIDPHTRGDTNLYACYYKRDYHRAADAFQCLTPARDTLGLLRVATAEALRSGANLRTYRLACAATGEYTQFHGSTVAAGMAAIATAINRVTGVYEAEVAIRLVLVANNDLIVYTNSTTDPYDNNNGSTMLGQNQSNLDSVIGNANYDIGHVFSTGGGGIATLSSVCLTGSKARGVTGFPAPTGDAFYIDFVAHELGHQFGANHTFNGTTGNCGGGNRNASTAYEPGSGSTIMAYAGYCGSDDLQTHSDPCFHSISFDEIIAYSTIGFGNSCPVLTSTGNSAPTVGAGANYTIPQSTPFTLTATATDPNGDLLTYCWEERDLGPAITVTTPDNGSSPLFRSFNPTTNAWRTFPKLSDILNTTITLGEMLPTTSRTMSFRVTARDNRVGSGGVNTSDTTVTVVSGAGPFVVTFPNSGTPLSGAQTVTWNVAGTASAPINAASVNILLSTNGGLSFPIVLAANTSNDGAHTVVLPNITNSMARIKVEAVGNIFFDISNTNFAMPGRVMLDSTALLSENCTLANNAIDPGETVTMNFTLKNTGSANTTNLVATLLATNGVVSPGGSQTYGVLPAGGVAVIRPFSFTATGACGGTITAILRLQDGATDLGMVSQTFNLGAFNTTTTTFTNAGAIAIPASGTKGRAEPYPSTISVVGVTGPVARIMVTLLGLTHSWVGDMDALLVGPTGQKVLIMSDAGDVSVVGDSLSNGTLTFDDGASSSLPGTGPVTPGTYQPTNYDPVGDSDTFSAPAPAAPYSTALSAFNGANPNGTWSLYVMDDAKSDTGSLAEGWQLSVTTSNLTCCSGVATNLPPVLPVQTNRTMDELTQLVVTNTAMDADIPANVLNYTLLAAPTGAVMSASGVINWMPSEAQGPSTNTLTAVVTDNGVPPLSATNSFTVVVREVNVAPVLAPIANQLTVSGETLILTNGAADADIPLNALTFSLEAGAPASASINATNGVFTWPTTGADGHTTNLITVQVMDDGVPPLTSTNTFSVIVAPFRPHLEFLTLSGNEVTVTWTAVAGGTYRLQYKTNLVNAEWTDLVPDIIATGFTVTNTESTEVAEQRFYRVMVVPR